MEMHYQMMAGTLEIYTVAIHLHTRLNMETFTTKIEDHDSMKYLLTAFLSTFPAQLNFGIK